MALPVATKRLIKSKYKYVWFVEKIFAGKITTQWRGEVLGKNKYFESEREAAIYVDKRLIEKGKNPVNILVCK